MGGAYGSYGEKRGAYRVMAEKPDGKTPLKVPFVSVRIIYKMDNQEVRWGGWAGLIWLRTGTGGRLL